MARAHRMLDETDLGELSPAESAMAASEIFDRVQISEADYAYGARLADDCFCQLCGARGVRGRLCGGCERSA